MNNELFRRALLYMCFWKFDSGTTNEGAYCRSPLPIRLYIAQGKQFWDGKGAGETRKEWKKKVTFISLIYNPTSCIFFYHIFCERTQKFEKQNLKKKNDIFMVFGIFEFNPHLVRQFFLIHKYCGKLNANNLMVCKRTSQTRLMLLAFVSRNFSVSRFVSSIDAECAFIA